VSVDPDLRAQLVAYRVPANLHDGLIRYVEQRIPTGSFLRACLEDDWTDAVNRADPFTGHYVLCIESFIRNVLPAECWGSPEKVHAWIEAGRRQLQQQRCDHKFIDSTVCVKCGWRPPAVDAVD
jgi:hypothetical protein